MGNICLTSFLIPSIFLLMGLTNLPAVFLIFCLGLCYSSQLLLYFVILAEFIPSELSAFGTGVAAALFNVGPAIVPYLVGMLHDNIDDPFPAIMCLFAAISFCVFICFNGVRRRILQDTKPSCSLTGEVGTNC